MSGLRCTAPTTGSPSAATASRASRSCRSLATWFSTTPAIRTPGSCVANPRAIAATVCDCPETSSTSSTGTPQRRARSAAAPLRPASAGMPSKSPMALSITTTSAPAACPAASRSMSPGAIAQLSRFTPGAPVAAAWNPGSM